MTCYRCVSPTPEADKRPVALVTLKLTRRHILARVAAPTEPADRCMDAALALVPPLAAAYSTEVMGAPCISVRVAYPDTTTATRSLLMVQSRDLHGLRLGGGRAIGVAELLPCSRSSFTLAIAAGESFTPVRARSTLPSQTPRAPPPHAKRGYPPLRLPSSDKNTSTICNTRLLLVHL